MKKSPTVVAALIVIIGVILIFIYSLGKNKGTEVENVGGIIKEEIGGTVNLSPSDHLPFPESEPYLAPPTTRPPNP